MYEYFKGRLVEKSPAHAIVECNGVGYYLNISVNTYTKLGNDENVKIYTYFAVREDAQVLYGFATKEERETFKLLISVSGIGASTARMILSSLDPNELQSAIINADVGTLKSVKGIGAKSAQRIIVDLKDKFDKLGDALDFYFDEGNTTKEESLSALIALGFDKKTSEKTITKILSDNGQEISVEDVIKHALKLM